MVEGGSTILAAFLAEGLADELQLAIAPRLVGDRRAPRFRGAPQAGLRLAEAVRLGDVMVLRYLLPGADRYWLRAAINEARRCPPSPAAFSVGAVIVDATGSEIARGYSRETGPLVHAEESALAKLHAGDPRLTGATMYSSLEPCSIRRSGPTPCAALILAAGIRRVVYAWREPVLFVDGAGAEELAAAGVEVVQLPELELAAQAVNAHLLPA
jgi:5-amino-6-(5-phosphoribosylamino)uracil reductase